MSAPTEGLAALMPSAAGWHYLSFNISTGEVTSVGLAPTRELAENGWCPPGSFRMLVDRDYTGEAVYVEDGEIRPRPEPDPAESAPSPVPAVISDRQFAQALALDGAITEGEALAWAARGDLPAALEAALDQIPEDGGQRFGARMLLAAATSYERAHPLVDTLGALLGYQPAEIDDLWRRAAAL